MSLFDVVTVAAAAFLTGWFVHSLVNLDTEDNKWPLVRRFLFACVHYTVLFLGGFCVSWRLNYHHLLPWQEFIVIPFISFAAASVVVYQQERRARFHIPSR